MPKYLEFRVLGVYCKNQYKRNPEGMGDIYILRHLYHATKLKPIEHSEEKYGRQNTAFYQAHQTVMHPSVYKAT